MPMTKLILFGELHSPNLGDSVICHISQVLFSKDTRDRDLEVHDVSFLLRGMDFWIANIRRLCYRLKIDSKPIEYYYYALKMFFSIKKKSTICYVGGALLQDFFMKQLLLVLKLARIKRCRVIFLSLGIGPISAENKLLLRKRIQALHDTDFMLRDGIPFFRDNIDNRVSWTPDLAIMAQDIYGGGEGREKVIGIGCINVDLYNANFPNSFISEENYISDIRALVRRILSYGYKVELFCNGDFNDFRVTEKIYKELSDNHVILKERPQTDEELINLVSSYCLVISSRLHSLIVAYSYNVPFIGIEWDPKIRFFAQSISCEHRIFAMNEISKIQKKSIDECNKEYDEKLKRLYKEKIRNSIRKIVNASKIS